MSVIKYTEYVNLSSGVCVIDFYATWCGPCKLLAPEYERVASKYPNFRFYKADVDEDDGIALSSKHDVSMVPTLLVLVKGKVKLQTQDMKELVALLDKIHVA